VVAALLAPLTAGCGGGAGPAGPVPSPTGSAAAVCAALAGALPPLVAGQPRAGGPRSPFAAAWGDPAIQLRCGVARPAALAPASQLATVNGVDWFAEQRRGGYLFTTWGRVVYVRVWVPDRYAPEVNPLVDLAAPVARTVPPSADQPGVPASTGPGPGASADPSGGAPPPG